MLVRTNFKYPHIVPEHYRFGKVSGTVLRPDGNWKDYVPNGEEQNKNGVETSACYIYAQTHAIATLEEEMWGEQNNDYSDRFNALMSGGGPDGGDPLKGADSLRHDGLVPESLMPFDSQTWEDFHSWKGVNRGQVIAVGQRYLMTRKLNNEIVVERQNAPDTKIPAIREALKYGPVPMSVYGWVMDDKGLYHKPAGVWDNHLVECVYVDDDGCPWIWDTYPPFLKRLAPNYNTDFAMLWHVRKLTEAEQLSQLAQILNLVLAYLRTLKT